MGYIIMKNWNVGLEKVTLTKLQMDILQVSLPQAKQNVDNLLDGKQPQIEVSNKDIAHLFIERAIQIGAICEFKLKED